MYLAQTENYKCKFEIFITYPFDLELKNILDNQIRALVGYYMPEDTSFHIEDRYGWAIFPYEDDPHPNDPSTPEERMKHEIIKEFIMDRLKDLLTHWIEWGPKHDRSFERTEYDGIEIMKDVEVECFYFYDNPKWYE